MHTHELLLGGRAKAAQTYPPKLCAAIVAGFAEQLKLDLAPTQESPTSPESEAPIFDLEILQVDQEDWVAEDDVHGGSLPAHLVLAARQTEIKYLQSRKVYSYSTDSDAWTTARKKPSKIEVD